MTGFLNWLKGLKHKGFIGPKYEGISGKLRLLWQGWYHEEIISCANAQSWRLPDGINNDVKVSVFDSYDQASPYLPAMSDAYSRDFAEEWQAYFGWGQVLALAFLEGRVAGFVWIQDGSKGADVPYLPLLPGEYRLVRGGILPGFRGKRVHTSRHALLLEHLFSNGAKRVYIDAFSDNVFSWKGQHKAGFQEIGRIKVRKMLGGKTYIRWLPRKRSIPARS